MNEDREDVIGDLQVGLLIQGPGAEILLSNPKALELLGLTSDQLLGKTSFDPSWNVIHDDGSPFPGPTHPVPQAIETRRPVRGVVMGVHRPAVGDRVWLLVDATPTLNEDGTVRRVVCTFTDISGRRRTEEALRASQAMLARTERIANVGSWEWDVPTDCVRWSDEMFRIFRRDPAAGAPSFAEHPALYEPDDMARLERAVEAAVRDGTPYEIELRAIRQDGVRRVCLARGHAELGPDGGAVRLFGSLQDITERKQVEDEKIRLEERLQQGQKMESIGRLAGGVAHDFNNMLSVIVGNAEIALARTPAPSPLRTDLEEILTAARRSADLTRQLLAFARKQPVTPRVLDLNQALPGMMAMLRRLIGEGIDLVWRPGDALWRVRVDPSQIDQIVANLCVNARDAISERGRITIETANVTLDEDYCASHVEASPGEYVRLSVADDGRGMDAAVLRHLFEPFFTTKGVGQGTGLGLATVYGIANQNRGFVGVESEVSRGTTFTVHLPRHAAEVDVAAAPERVASCPRGKETLLVVEDEPAILRLTRQMLDGRGYDVLAAATPGEAIRIATEHRRRIDVLVTDVIMPEMNGPELLRRLLSLYPGLRCLFVSGYAADVVDAVEPGTAFLEKPFTEAELTGKLRRLLDEDGGGARRTAP